MTAPGPIATVVVCERDRETLDLLCDRLASDRLEPLPATTAEEAWRLCRRHGPDLLLLDLELPEDSGSELLHRIRGVHWLHAQVDPGLPVIALASGVRDPWANPDPGMAVDDLLRKPFGYEDLRARIEAILRRRHSRRDEPVRVGDLLVDPARRKVKVGDREVHLAKKEFTLLRVLASDPTRVFAKEELLRDIWGIRDPAAKTRTLDSHASRLRRKLDPEHRRFVVNCWGVGYRLVDSIDDGRSLETPGRRERCRRMS